MKRVRKPKKSPFLLLELMVALSLIALCALPLIRAPALHIQKQLLALEEIQLHLESEKTLSEIKEKFYTHSLSWQEIESAEKKPLLLSEDRIVLLGLSSYLKTCSLKSAVMKEGKNTQLWAKVLIEISFAKPKGKEKKFLHTLTLCQKPLPPASNFVSFD